MPRRTTTSLCTAALVTVCLAGCGAGSAGAATSAALAPDPSATASAVARGVVLTAELDTDSGAVVLPFDRFATTWNEQAVIAAAANTLVAVCAADHGVDVTVQAPQVDAVYGSELYYGPWTVEQAEQFGFAPPSPAQEQTADDSPTTDVGGVDDQAVLARCGDLVEVNELTSALLDDGPWLEPLAVVTQGLVERPGARSALSDLADCLEEEGLQVDADSPWLPEGADPGTTSDEQVTLALQLVGCKTTTGFTERMSSIEASEQVPIVVTYVDELETRRAAVDEALESARAILVEHPEVRSQP